MEKTRKSMGANYESGGREFESLRARQGLAENQNLEKTVGVTPRVTCAAVTVCASRRRAARP
jgi:hypothetical protein